MKQFNNNLTKNPFLQAIFFSFLLTGQLKVVQAGTVEVGTQFTYQGELIDNGSPANGVYDLLIILYSAPTGGTQIDFEVIDDIQITDGLFSAELDFGDAPFSGDERFLEVNVRNGNSNAGYSILLPRSRVNPTPYAIQAEFAENGGSPWAENGSGLSYDNDVIIGNAATTTGSLLTVDTSGGQSPVRFKIDGSTKLIIRENGGLSVGVNTSGVPENGLYVNGKVRQPLDQHGFAKGGVTFVCGNSGTTINDEFNNENTNGFIISSAQPENGRCSVSVPFEITDSFLMANTSAVNFPRGVACGKTTDGGGNDVIECNAWNPLNGERVDAVVTLLLF